MQHKKILLIGGAGFIGSHFIDAFLLEKTTEKVTVYDNFSSGKSWHYQHHLSDTRFSVIHADVKELSALKLAMTHHDLVMHFASNPDIARAVKEPAIDFVEGIYLTQQVLEAMRETGVKRLLYMSGSGVYGDTGTNECVENQGNLHPISTYGASKLAGEAFISSYCALFGISAVMFRFANVVGARQTHGVAYDFIQRLKNNPTQLAILGNGLQSKSYIHISDVIRAVLLANEKLSTGFEIYNVATNDHITVREIAEIVINQLQLENNPAIALAGGDRGWPGDVPIIRLNTAKIRALGWHCQKTTAEAIQASVNAMITSDAHAEKISA